MLSEYHRFYDAIIYISGDIRKVINPLFRCFVVHSLVHCMH